MKEDTIQKLNALFENNEEVQQKAAMISDFEELHSLISNNGVDISREELTDFLLEVGQCVSEVMPEDELSEDDLDDVAGGIAGTIIIGKSASLVAGLLGGAAGVLLVAGVAYCGYKLYKAATK